MAINDALMLSILAMDVYNQGPNRQIQGDWTTIGSASLSSASSSGDESTIGFFAQSYSWSGQSVISYRGTDDFETDGRYGYGIAAGLADGSFSEQGRLALEFYRSVMTTADPRDANILLTGHSLGGGLAGYVASLYLQEGVVFDNMPFQLAATNAYELSRTH